MSPTQLLFGFHAVMARLRRDPASIARILVRRDRTDERAAAALREAATGNVRVEQVDGETLDELVGHRRHQGISSASTISSTRSTSLHSCSSSTA